MNCTFYCDGVIRVYHSYASTPKTGAGERQVCTERCDSVISERVFGPWDAGELSRCCIVEKLLGAPSGATLAKIFLHI
jgi:hypothetical protein